jgi:glycogen(starch) synthase
LTKENLFTESFLTETKKKLLKFHKPGKNPSIATHDLSDEQGDQILRALSENGLHNKIEDRVKVVYYPTYLTGADGLLDLAYYETITGAHLGVFPSYYEPWGYTPLEAAALGVASVTTDLSGFGKFICGECAQIENPGVYVLERLNKSYDDIVQGLYNILYHYASLTKDGRIENKIEAHRVAELADWKKLIKNYFEAHSLAATKIFG